MTDKNIDLQKLVAGEFSDQVEQIFCDGNIGVFLTAPTHRQHVWLAYLAHSPVGEETAYVDSEFLFRAPAKQILSQCIPNLALGYVSALKKLPLGALSGNLYRVLHDLLVENGRRAKAIRHADTLSGGKIEIIHILDECIFSDRLLSLCETKISAGAVSFAYNKLSHKYPSIKPEQFRNVLAQCEENWRIDDKLAELLWSKLQLPRPPLRVNGATPLDSVEKIGEAGRRFDNCLCHSDEYIKSCLTGRSYLYEWKGEEGAIIQIEHDLIWGWVISEIRLKGNDHPSFDKAWPIVQAFGLPPLLIGFHLLTSMKSTDLGGLDEEDSLAVELMLAYNDQEDRGISDKRCAA